MAWSRRESRRAGRGTLGGGADSAQHCRAHLRSERCQRELSGIRMLLLGDVSPFSCRQPCACHASICCRVHLICLACQQPCASCFPCVTMNFGHGIICGRASSDQNSHTALTVNWTSQQLRFTVYTDFAQCWLQSNGDNPVIGQPRMKIGEVSYGREK